MKRLALHYGFQSAATAVALTLSTPVMAGQIDSVCKTDDQTFNNIKSDPDQTLWGFMQAVCQGEFVITQAPTRPQALAVNPPTSEASLLRAEVAVAPIVRVGASAQSVTNPNNISTTISHDQGVTASTETGALPKQSFLEIGIQPAKTNEPSISLAKREKTPEQNRAEVVAQAQPDNTASHQGSHEIPTNTASEVQATEDRETNDKGYQSKRPWLYSLLGPQVSSSVIEALPPPIEYKPSRFSDYKPNYLGETTASNHGTRYLQKPEVMSVTPHGFFSSLYWHSYKEPGFMKQSGPGYALGFVDERAVREWKDYPGMGSRLELGQMRIKYKGSGEFTNDAYYFLGELYKPIASGFYVGLGYRRLNDRKDPVQISSIGQILSSTGYLMYNRLSEYLYLPIGIAGKIGKESTYKLQLNALVKGQQTSSLGRIGDGNIKNDQNSGWGVDLAYAPSNKAEVFFRYWNIDDSEITVGPVTGAHWIEPKNATMEAGIRAWW